jgi:hypothetical protein
MLLTPRPRRNASFIAISTLTSDLNFYTKLISKVDPMTHKPIFKSVQIQLACQACIDAERAHECTHNMHLIPAWHNEEKHTRLKAIMSDRPGMYVCTKNCEHATFCIVAPALACVLRVVGPRYWHSESRARVRAQIS